MCVWKFHRNCIIVFVCAHVYNSLWWNSQFRRSLLRRRRRARALASFRLLVCSFVAVCIKPKAEISNNICVSACSAASFVLLVLLCFCFYSLACWLRCVSVCVRLAVCKLFWQSHDSYYKYTHLESEEIVGFQVIHSRRYLQKLQNFRCCRLICQNMLGNPQRRNWNFLFNFIA